MGFFFLTLFVVYTVQLAIFGDYFVNILPFFIIICFGMLFAAEDSTSHCFGMLSTAEDSVSHCFGDLSALAEGKIQSFEVLSEADDGIFSLVRPRFGGCLSFVDAL